MVSILVLVDAALRLFPCGASTVLPVSILVLVDAALRRISREFG